MNIFSELKYARAVLAVVVATITATITVGVGPPSAARAGDKPIPAQLEDFSPAITAKMLAQQPLKEAASRIQRSVGRPVGDRDTGYAGIGLGESEVLVWWKGELPRQVEQTISEVRAKTPVRVVSARYSRAELSAAAKGAGDYLRTHKDSPYNGVTIAADGSGLTVLTSSKSVRAQAVPEEMKTPMGIKASVAERDAPQLSTRVNDSVPFWGGGRIQNNDNNAGCSAGFSVSRGATYYMLTAGHCGRVGGTWNNGDDTRFFGTGAYENVGHDLLLISANVAGRIFDGGVGAGEFTKGVEGWDYAWPGEWLCSSASVTGALCNHVVSGEFYHTMCGNDAYGNRECYNDLVVSWQWDGKTASQPGDSGGPVFGLSGPSRVIAKGTITGVVSGNGLIFQDFANAWWDFGIVPVIG